VGIFPIAFQYELVIIIVVVNKTDVSQATLALMVLQQMTGIVARFLNPKEGLA
jgi:hypothetical protein